MRPGQPAATPFFFLSYARNDDVDGSIRRFFRDLDLAVSLRRGARPGSSGFLDLNLPPGSQWATKTGAALAGCKVFVPMYSPSLFGSGYCGREWQSFHDRLITARTSTELILPVWWIPPNRDLPAVAADLQDPRDAHGDEFRSHGLYHLRRLKRLRDAYREFVTLFAEQMVKAAERHELGDGTPTDLRLVDDAFVRPAGPAGRHPARSGDTTSWWVRFIVVAGSQEQMREHRTNIDYYGARWDAWRPYHPVHDDPVGMHAQRLAGAQRFHTGLTAAGKDLVQQVRQAEEAREIVVLLLDSWATHIDEYAALLEEFDCVQFNNTAIVVPSSSADDETSARLHDLRAGLFRRLNRSMRHGAGFFREDTPTVETFEQAVQQVIVDVREWMVAEIPASRRAGGDAVRRQPRIAGPGGGR